MSNIVTLDYVVKNVLADIYQDDLRHYQRCLNWAIRGYRQLNMNSLSNYKTVSIAVDNLRSIDIPKDFLSLVKLGVYVGGEFLAITNNDYMSLPDEKDDCGNPLPTTDETDLGGLQFPVNIGFSFLPHYQNNQYVAGLYGNSGAINGDGYYKVDNETNKIFFSSSIDTDKRIVLVYNSDGTKADGSTMVKKAVVEALIAWTHWKRVQNKRGVSEGAKAARRKDFIDEFANLRSIELSFTASEYLDSTRKNIKQSPKR